MRPSNSRLWSHCTRHQRFEYSCHDCLVATVGMLVRDNDELRGIAEDALKQGKQGRGR